MVKKVSDLDDAGDYFRDTYGGVMVNLWGLLPVIGGWGRAVAGLSDATRRRNGRRSMPAWTSTA